MLNDNHESPHSAIPTPSEPMRHPTTDDNPFARRRHERRRRELGATIRWLSKPTPVAPGCGTLVLAVCSDARDADALYWHWQAKAEQAGA
jgi:hypothetical protein